MRDKLEVYTRYNENKGVYYKRFFYIVDELPELKADKIDDIKNGKTDCGFMPLAEKIEKIKIDPEQPYDCNFLYDYYKITYFLPEEFRAYDSNHDTSDFYTNEEFIAILKDGEKD